MKSQSDLLWQGRGTLEQSRLSWSSIPSDIIVSGDTQLNSLKNIKNTVLALRREFSSTTDPKIQLNYVDKEDFDKRMILLENQVEGLMRRKINFAIKDQTGQRTLDYSGILNEKENQIIQLQKKIQNLQFRLRKATARQNQLENHIVYLNDQLRIKQEIIKGKNQIIFAQVATNNLLQDTINKIKTNITLNKYKIQDLQKIVLNEVIFPDIGTYQIKADVLTRSGAVSRSKSYQEMGSTQQTKTRLVQMFRELQRILNQTGEITEIQVERVLEGFMISQKQSRLYEKSMTALKRDNIQEKYQQLKENFAIAAGIYQNNLEKLKSDNPNIRINFEKNLFQILQRENVNAYQIQNGAVFIDSYTEKTVEVPVQDARAKHLLHLFAVQMKKFSTKYPQLLKEMDKKLCEFFQQQIIDMIEVDEVDRLVNIVKYVPQIVKVQNVYAYSNEKSRKVEFHLRVLIKALLEELQKIKKKTGVVLQMDEGVIGMISAQIMGVVNVDDILKVFRPVPKIVEVQKIVQKIVERRVEVPMVVPICKQVQKIVQIQKIIEVQKIVNVPLEIPVIQTQIVDKIVPVEQIIQRVVQVPTVVQKIVYITQQVPKVIEVPVNIQKIVEVEKIIQVEKVVNHIQEKPQQIQVIKEIIVPVETIIEKIVQVPVIIQKIVERIVQVPKVEIIQKIVQKAVPIIQYRKALQVNNHIETIHKPVDRIIQKIVPVIRTIQRIVEVPQIVEKIKQVIVQKVQIREVEVIRQKIIKHEVPKQIQVIVKQIVEVIKEVPIEVEKIVEIPVIHEVVKKVVEIVQKPIIQKVEKTIIQQVYLRDPLIVYQPRIVQVEKIINRNIEIPKPVKYYEQKIVQIPRNVERIKQVRVEVQKIIQKMVQVPKIVEVQRIVEKIVVVPRVIQKVIEVPQIIQKIVERQVQKIVVRQVQRRFEIPVIQQRIVQIEVIKNIYIEVEKPVQRIVDKLVTVNNYEEKATIHEIKVQNVIEVIRQVPKTMHVDKIVPAYHEVIRPIEIEKVQIVPYEIPVPVEVVIEKVIPVRQIVEKIIQVPQFIQKIVQTKQQDVKIQYIEKIVQKIVIDERIKEVEKIVPYIQEVIKQIPTIVQKIVTVQSKVQEIITAQQIVQKIVEKTKTITQIVQIQKQVPKLIEVPKIIQVDRIIPQIIRVNEYIQKVVEKIVEVPRIIQKIRQIQVQREKIVQVNNVFTQIKQIERVVEKIAILEQMKQVIKNVNHIEKVIRIVQQIERVPVQIAVKEQILVQIPYILQKIVQKIVIMPQIVQVLKYVHQISQSNELLTVENEKQFQNQQLKFIQLTRNIKPSLDNLVRQLRTLRNNSQFTAKAQLIQSFLIQLDKLIAYPKLIRIQSKQKAEQRIIQKQVVVKVPVQDEHSLRKQISMSILIEKLILEIKRLTSVSKLSTQLDDQIKMIFFAELQSQNRYSLQGQLKDKFNRYASQINRKFQSLGPWAAQNQLILHSILQQRFKYAQIIEDANMQIQRAKLQYNDLLVILQDESKARKSCEEMMKRLRMIFESYSSEKQSQIVQIQKFLEEYQSQRKQYQQAQQKSTNLTRLLRQSQMITQSTESKLRERETTINQLKDEIQKMRRTSTSQQSKLIYSEDYVRGLQRSVQEYRKNQSRSDIQSTRADISKLQSSYRQHLLEIQKKNQQLEQEKTDLKNQLQNCKRQLRVIHENEKFLMRRDDKTIEWNVKKIPEYSAESLSHSEIKRVDQSVLSQSQYSIYHQYEPRVTDYRQSPSNLLKATQQKQKKQIQGLMTPLDTNKYRSPQTTGMKLAQSIWKQQSRSMTAQSPQGHQLFTTPSSIKHQRQKQAEEDKSKQYQYYYSPDQRGKP